MDHSSWPFGLILKGQLTVPNPDSFGGKGNRSKRRAIRVCRRGRPPGKDEGGRHRGREGREAGST